MHVLILGAAGMIGRKLSARLVRDGNVGGRAIVKLTLADVNPPQQPAYTSGEVATVGTDLAAAGRAEQLLADRPDLIFHLAAVVSGEAEADFDKGYAVNLDGSRALLEAVRAAHLADGYHPRLVFASSIAVYGAPLPNPIPEDFLHTPLTSYGTQKAIVELLLTDYTRRGFVDGIGIRLPTICIRPGKPNQAASGFFSSILREPLVGRRRSSRSPRRSDTGTPRLARPLSSSSGRPPSTDGHSVHDGPSPCPGSAQPSASRSRPCAASPATRPSA